MLTREDDSDDKNTQKTSNRFWSRDLFCELKLVISLDQTTTITIACSTAIIANQIP